MSSEVWSWERINFGTSHELIWSLILVSQSRVGGFEQMYKQCGAVKKY